MTRRSRIVWALGLAAWALALGNGCGDPGGPDPAATCGTRAPFYDEGRGVLHPAHEPFELGIYRCASRELQVACAAGREPYRQDLNGHLRPGSAPGELVRCVGPAFQG